MTKKKRVRLAPPVSCLFLVVVYALSIGPMSWVAEQPWFPDQVSDWLGFFYTPAWWVAERVGLDSELLNYIAWWVQYWA